jgi:hypothetical protein
MRRLIGHLFRHLQADRPGPYICLKKEIWSARAPGPENQAKGKSV